MEETSVKSENSSRCINDWDSFQSSFEERVEKFHTFYNMDKLYMANEEWLTLEESLKFHFDAQKDNPKYEKMNEKLKLNSKRALQLKTEITETDALLKQFQSHEGWTVTKETEGIKVYYRHEESTKVHSIKLEGNIDCPIFNVIATMYEHDLYVDWVPLLKCLYGYGVDMLEKDCILITVRSCRDDEVDVPLPNKHVRMDVKIGGVLLKPISNDKCHAILIGNADPKFAAIPYSLLNLVTKQLSVTMFQMLRKKCINIAGSEYEKRIASNPQIYGEIRERVNEHFQKK